MPIPLLEILSEHDLWIPATFAGCHWGSHETWFPPNGGSGSRLDYVIAPVGWSVPADGSYVLEGLDFGQTSIDHFGFCLHIHCECSATEGRDRGLARLDQAKMATPEGQSAIRRICQEAPLFP